jgi:hypothetical protein
MGFEERNHQRIQGTSSLKIAAVPKHEMGLDREVARFERALSTSPMHALQALLKSPYQEGVLKQLAGECLYAMNSVWKKATHAQRYSFEQLARQIARDQTSTIYHRECALGFISHQKADPTITKFIVNQIKKYGFWDTQKFGLGWGTEDRAIDLLRAVSGENFASILKTTIPHNVKYHPVWNFYRFRELHLLVKGSNQDLQSAASALNKELKEDIHSTTTQYVRKQLNRAQELEAGFTQDLAKTLQSVDQTKALGVLYERAINNGITRPYRFSEDILNKLLKNSKQIIPNNKPFALIVLNRSDKHGAFSDECATIKQLMNAGYFVRLVEASNESDFMNQLQKNCTGRKADLLVIGGHGSKTIISLGGADPQVSRNQEDERLSIDINDADVLRSIGQSTAPRGQVFLLSCNTAEGGSSANNFAKAVDKACLPSVTVFAARISVSKSSFEFSKISTEYGMWPKIRRVNFAEADALHISPGR